MPAALRAPKDGLLAKTKGKLNATLSRRSRKGAGKVFRSLTDARGARVSSRRPRSLRVSHKEEWNGSSQSRV